MFRDSWLADKFGSGLAPCWIGSLIIVEEGQGFLETYPKSQWKRYLGQACNILSNTKIITYCLFTFAYITCKMESNQWNSQTHQRHIFAGCYHSGISQLNWSFTQTYAKNHVYIWKCHKQACRKGPFSASSVRRNGDQAHMYIHAIVWSITEQACKINTFQGLKSYFQFHMDTCVKNKPDPRIIKAINMNDLARRKPILLSHKKWNMVCDSTSRPAADQIARCVAKFI